MKGGAQAPTGFAEGIKDQVQVITDSGPTFKEDNALMPTTSAASSVASVAENA